MNRPTPLPVLLCSLLLLVATPRRAPAQPSPAAVAAFNAAAAQIEQRLSQQRFTASAPGLQHLPEPAPAGALMHHWRATAFAPGARAADFEQLLRDFDRYPRHFAPQVLAAHATPLGPNRFTATLRVRQKHVLTVVLDSTCDVTFNPDSSTSRSTAIAELDPDDQPLPPAAAHGFLWRINSYWTWRERDGGLALTLETLSLSRAIPTGLGWALKPYVESVPRESLDFTLQSALHALAQKGAAK